MPTEVFQGPWEDSREAHRGREIARLFRGLGGIPVAASMVLTGVSERAFEGPFDDPDGRVSLARPARDAEGTRMGIGMARGRFTAEPAVPGPKLLDGPHVVGRHDAALSCLGTAWPRSVNSASTTSALKGVLSPR